MPYFDLHSLFVGFSLFSSDLNEFEDIIDVSSNN